MSTRRELLRCGLAAGIVGAGSAVGLPAFAGSLEPRRVAVQNLHTGEALNAVYWENGSYVTDAVSALNKVLRDHRTNEVHFIDPGLYDILDAISAKVDKREAYQIISGYRSPKSNAMLKRTGGGGVATHSLHMDGKAMDVRLAGVQLTNLHKAALSLKKGGVGFYPVSNFVHVDVGRVRTWNGA